MTGSKEGFRRTPDGRNMAETRGCNGEKADESKIMNMPCDACIHCLKENEIMPEMTEPALKKYFHLFAVYASVLPYPSAKKIENEVDAQKRDNQNIPLFSTSMQINDTYNSNGVEQIT